MIIYFTHVMILIMWTYDIMDLLQKTMTRFLIRGVRIILVLCFLQN